MCLSKTSESSSHRVLFSVFCLLAATSVSFVNGYTFSSRQTTRKNVRKDGEGHQMELNNSVFDSSKINARKSLKLTNDNMDIEGDLT